MAANWQPIYSIKTIQVLSETSIVDVEMVTFKTIPHGITATYGIPYSLWIAEEGPQQVTMLATVLEDCAASHHVVGGSPAQDLDTSGLLNDFVDLIVEYVPPNNPAAQLFGTVHLSTNDLYETALSLEFPGGSGGYTNAFTACDQEYARLKALAAG